VSLIRSSHRLLGIVMLLPFVGWAVTGAIFFIKPGYGDAYDVPAIKTYPLESGTRPDIRPGWLEVRWLRTVLGEHCLVRTSDGWKQIDPRSFEDRAAAPEPDLRRLLDDAFSANRARYGQVARLDGPVATTDTGVRVTLNWNRLTLSQRGPDTDRIDRLYKIHYLQWTGIAALDKLLGGTGLTLVVALSVLGVRLFVRR
jgi:hypothetical protein